MARSWLSVRVELVSGHGEALWPRPGRVFAVARSHTFAQLAEAIDLAFARWDLAHLHMFTLADETPLTHLELWDGEAPEGALDSDLTKLSRVKAGERFAYVFDLGDEWTHLCTVGEQRIDPLEEVGMMPGRPVPYMGWGTIPDQYSRSWEDDDGEGEEPKPLQRPFEDLPPILPLWGTH